MRDYTPYGENMRLSDIKILLDKEVSRRNTLTELSYDRPDPLLVASKYKDESIALICALFGYGNAGQIVKFLESLDFSFLEASEKEIRLLFSGHYYRFQKPEDVIAIFIALKRLKEYDSIENIFYQGYRKEENILDGLWQFIAVLKKIHPYSSQGYNFLIGKLPRNVKSAGTYKRYMMYLRWMVRDDSLDMGLWPKIDRKDLLIPLDTHTFKMSGRLGLLKRKSYDMKAVVELTERFRRWDEEDPIKYDFALYRLGQENKLKF